MTDHRKHILLAQLQAALAMLKECLEKCPPAHWDEKIANYTFGQVAYHTLCFLDLYLSHDDASCKPCQNPRAPGGGLHPTGRAEPHLYNLRHVKHHAGQLSTSLRRIGVDTAWARSGWR